MLLFHRSAFQKEHVGYYKEERLVFKQRFSCRFRFSVLTRGCGPVGTAAVPVAMVPTNVPLS